MRPASRAGFALILFAFTSSAWPDESGRDPLPSWNSGTAKQAILDFVRKTTKEGGPEFVPVGERIAVFDNDGTLWPENPLPFELAFALDRVKSEAAKHPEWKEKQPFKAVLENDHPALVASGKKGLVELILATHTGMTTAEFDLSVKEWITTAKHPRYGKLYTELGYAPMLEVLAHLRANGYKTFIVSGGVSDFMRVWAEKMYGIPPEQVVGTMFETAFELKDDQPRLRILPKIALIDDHGGKPVGIRQVIGRQPVMGFGNSDGDLQMLQWTTIGRKPSFGLIVHHTDEEREYAYDEKPKSSGKLIEGLKEAPTRSWTVVDMKRDWNRVFRFDQ